MSGDDQSSAVEELTQAELTALLMSIGSAMMRATAAADMPTVARLGMLMQQAQKFLMRYQNHDAEALDAQLQAQFAERRRRVAAGEISGDSLVYSFKCSQCGAPINHMPENDYEEIHCPTCGGAVSFDKSKAQAGGGGTEAAMSNEEKGARMVAVAEELRQAQAAGDVALAQQLQEEYNELANSFAMNFDYSAHQGIYDEIADRHGDSLKASARTNEIYAEIQEVEAEIEALAETLRRTKPGPEREPLVERWQVIHRRKNALNREFEEVQAVANQSAPLTASEQAAYDAQQAQEADSERAVFEAAARNDFPAVKAILTDLQAGVSPNIEDAEERSLLGYLVGHGNVEAVDWMLRFGLTRSSVLANEYECCRSDVRRTVIFTAIDAGNREMVDLLLQGGAELDSGDATRDDLKPLHAAVLRNDAAMVQSFVRRILADKGAVDISDMGLMRAVLAKNLEAVFEADEIDPTDDMSDTPLHYAARAGARDIVEILVGAGAEASATNDEDETPADLARGAGHEDLARYLEQLD